MTTFVGGTTGRICAKSSLQLQIQRPKNQRLHIVCKSILYVIYGEVFCNCPYPHSYFATYILPYEESTIRITTARSASPKLGHQLQLPQMRPSSSIDDTPSPLHVSWQFLVEIQHRGQPILGRHARLLDYGDRGKGRHTKGCGGSR